MDTFRKRPVRRASVINPYGVGAIVDFPKDESLIVAGLDAWPLATKDCPPEWLVVEERLQARLRKSHFRLPPHYTNKSENPELNGCCIPALPFPGWHVCGFCGIMRYKPSGNRLCQSDKCQGKQHRLVPIRFVAACEKGHLSDIPWRAYVHDGTIPDSFETGHELTYQSGASAGLSGIQIKCSCGAKKNLGGLFNFDVDRGSALSSVGIRCDGSRPWLADSTYSCGEHLHVLQKGASNIYFPHILSAIYLPLWAEREDARIISILENPRYFTVLTDHIVDGKISDVAVKMVAKLAHVDPDALRKAAQRRIDGVDVDEDSEEEDFRTAEYRAIKDQRGGPDTALFVRKQELTGYESWISEFLEGIFLIPKLRETRVFTGFSRVLPPEITGDNLAPLSRSNQMRWLPATTVQGEGIFLEFRRDRLLEFSNIPEVMERTSTLCKSVNLRRQARGHEALVITTSQLLIHTFAHLLIRQLCFDCGYGSSALRERLYVTDLLGSNPLHGVLIYTAAGDSEGTLGGLVRQGEQGHLERVIREALRQSLWCSSDPVCIESVSQGSDASNLAACHSCSLLPETSCEMGNRYLDRGLVVGLPEKPQLSFFGHLGIFGQ